MSLKKSILQQQLRDDFTKLQTTLYRDKILSVQDLTRWLKIVVIFGYL